VICLGTNELSNSRSIPPTHLPPNKAAPSNYHLDNLVLFDIYKEPPLFLIPESFSCYNVLGHSSAFLLFSCFPSPDNHQMAIIPITYTHTWTFSNPHYALPLFHSRTNFTRITFSPTKYGALAPSSPLSHFRVFCRSEVILGYPFAPTYSVGSEFLKLRLKNSTVIIRKKKL